MTGAALRLKAKRSLQAARGRKRLVRISFGGVVQSGRVLIIDRRVAGRRRDHPRKAFQRRPSVPHIGPATDMAGGSPPQAYFRAIFAFAKLLPGLVTAGPSSFATSAQLSTARATPRA